MARQIERQIALFYEGEYGTLNSLYYRLVAMWKSGVLAHSHIFAVRHYLAKWLTINSWWHPELFKFTLAHYCEYCDVPKHVKPQRFDCQKMENTTYRTPTISKM